MIYVLIVCSFTIPFTVYMAWRNNAVFEFRTNLAATAFDLAKKDAMRGVEDFMWRVRVYQSVSYHEMMLKFWKPLTVSSFYGDASFIDGSVIKDSP